MFDAYTIKKVLPRLVAAVILIQLSWFIFTGLISITNVVSFGLEALIAAPFGGTQNLQLENILRGANVNPGATILTTAAVGAVGVIGAGGFLALAVFVLLALVVGYFVLVLRRILLIALLITAPIAIVAWILPGTQRIWKLWWDNFSKLVLMFPLIVLMLAGGRAVGYVAANSATADGSKVVLVLAAVFTPFFLIPATYKAAGVGLAFAAGWIGGRANTLSDSAGKRGRTRRAERAKDRSHRALNDNFFRGGNDQNLRGRLNRRIQQGTTLASGRAGINPLRMGGNMAAVISTGTRGETSELLEKDEAIKAVAPDDDLASAVQFGTSDADIERRLIATGRHGTQGSADLAKNVALVRAAQRSGSTTAVRSAMAIAKAQSGTGYGSHAEMYESIIQAAGGDRNLEGQLLASVRSGSERARRADLATPGHVDQELAMNRIRSAMGGDPTQYAAARSSVNTDMRREAMVKAGAGAILASRPAVVDDQMVQLGRDWDAAMASGDVNQAIELSSQIASFRNAMGSAPPEARQAVMGLLDHVGIDPSAVNPDTGLAYSVDDQLGSILARTSGRDVAGLTQEIRTRAGLYDAGGGDRTPEQMRGLPPAETS